MLITEMAVFEFDHNSHDMILKEIAEDSTLEEVRESTGCDFLVSNNITRF